MALTHFSRRLHPRDGIETLQELMRGQLDLLVPPLGGAVVAGDQAHAVQPPEVAVHERVARLRLVVRPLGEPEVPGGVLLPGVLLEERVLLLGAGLHGVPLALEDVLLGVDQGLGFVYCRGVELVGRDPAIVANCDQTVSRMSNALGTVGSSSVLVGAFAHPGSGLVMWQ